MSLVTEKNISTDAASYLRKAIEAGDPHEALRNEALANFERLGFPAPKAEEYKHTPLTRLLEKNFSFGAANAPAAGVNVASVFIPNVTGNVLVFINGQFSARDSQIAATDGLTILTLSEAQKTHGATIAKHLGKVADHTTDAFAAFNTASWTDGVFVHVAANKTIEKPVLIYHIHDTQAGQVISAARNLVVLEKSSEVTILEKQDTFGSGNGFSTVVSEAVVGENAGLSWYSIQNDGGNRYHFDFKQIYQSNSSRVNTFTFTLAGKAIRNNLSLALDGQGIDSHMYGLYLIGKDTLADNHTVVDHKQPNSFSNELYKGIMEDNAKGVFNGKIYVRPNAQKTNAFQANRNILLTDRATVNTKPQLEIWADDVKCSHGCTSGQLDEEALFYLRTRGIEKDTAQAMMLYAFAGELLEPIRNEELKTYIDDLISERLHKNF
jgi:Fe-S cluster assembly protein SufD